MRIDRALPVDAVQLRRRAGPAPVRVLELAGPLAMRGNAAGLGIGEQAKRYEEFYGY